MFGVYDIVWDVEEERGKRFLQTSDVVVGRIPMDG